MTGRAWRWSLIAVASIGGLAAAGGPSRAEEPFGQETVEIRPPHQPAATVRQSHRHAHRGHDRPHPDHRTAPGHRHADTADRHGHGGHEHGVETENLFGFTLGSDVEEAGAKGVALETAGRFGKRGGRYRAIAQKLEFAYGLTDRFSVAFGAFASHHRIAGVPGLEDVNAYAFNGFGGELRWQLLDRKTHPFGLTVHTEPSAQTRDELPGKAATKYGAENKLILDTELVKDRVFAAFNLIHELERVREHGSDAWENGSKIGVAVALTQQVVPKTFVGAELRYLRAYEGLALRSWTGDALYVGPTLFLRIAPSVWLAAAWNVQVAGREAGTGSRLDLTNFERHQAQLKVGAEF